MPRQLRARSEWPFPALHVGCCACAEGLRRARSGPPHSSDAWPKLRSGTSHSRLQFESARIPRSDRAIVDIKAVGACHSASNTGHMLSACLTAVPSPILPLTSRAASVTKGRKRTFAAFALSWHTLSRSGHLDQAMFEQDGAAARSAVLHWKNHCLQNMVAMHISATTPSLQGVLICLNRAFRSCQRACNGLSPGPSWMRLLNWCGASKQST
jgi:hypothetical protein